MFYIANYGTSISGAAVAAINSFVALGDTPAGQHLAKVTGLFANTADTGGAATITTQDEGVTLSTTVTTLNFVGAGVTASGAGATTTITIPGGSGLTVGTSTIASGTTTRVLFDNAGVLGEYTISGTGNVAMTTSPTFVTPTLGVATGTSFNGLTITTSTGTLTIANGKTGTFSNTITIAGTDGSTLNVGTGGTLGTAAFTNSTAYEVPLTFSTGLTRSVNTITVNTSQNIATLSNLTSNGLVTTSGGTGALSITVPGTGVLTFLSTPSSANLSAALTDKTGTGVNVFATSPTLVTPVLGVATATSLNGLTVTTTTGTFTLTNGKTLAVTNTLTFSGTDSTVMTFPNATDTVMGLGATQTVTGNKTFNDGKLILAGSSSGASTLKAPAVASTYTHTLPAMTTTLASVGSTTEASNTATVVAIAGIHHTHTITALAAGDTFGVPTVATGALDDTCQLIIRIKDNGTARALSFNAIFRASSDLALPTTTIVNKTLYLGFKYNVADTKWDLLALLNNF